MAFLRLLVFVTLLGLVFAGPLGSGKQQCECKTCGGCGCPCGATPSLKKLSFSPGKSYIYDYKGHSRVQLDGVRPEASAALEWGAEVILSWESACQVTVEIRKPTMNGQAGGRILQELLASKPMTASVVDGVVTGVCADAHDHPTGLNLKKGIISSIQNVLPEISSQIAGKIFVENDIMGRCPTTYTVRDMKTSYEVIKSKNHKECSGFQVSEGGSAASTWWTRMPPVPVNESHSECQQVIRKHDNITTSVTCKDRKIVNGMPDKPILTIQESKLTLKQVVSASHIPRPNPSRKTDLAFEVVPQPHTKDVIPKIEKLLKDLCDSTKHNTTRESASYLAKMIGYLYRAPEKSIKQIHSNIKAGHYCSQSSRIESLFLDAVAFVGNAGAVELMVEQVTSGEVSGGRTPLYAIALHLLQRPCIHSVEAVVPLLSSEKAPSYMVLAAGSLVRKYCRFHSECLQDAPVKAILEKLTSVVQSSCSSAQDSQEKIRALTALKTIGNIGNMTKSVEQALLKCAQSKQADTYIRITASRAFRHASCRDQPTSELLDLLLDRSENTEVRIAAYTTVMQCASKEQIQTVLSKISTEPNTQVRSYILSHLHNLQKSDAPHLRGLRYNLTSFIIPTDHEQDFRKQSYNADLSYYSRSLGLGAGVDTNVIFTPGSYLPRQLHANISADLFDNVINIGEFSVRIEDIEKVADALFGTDGYLRKTPLSTIKKDLLNLAPKITQELKEGSRSSEGQMSSLLQKVMFSKKGSRTPEVDTFARIFGQEVLFSSLAPSLKDVKFDELVQEAFETIIRTISHLSDMNVDFARGLQTDMESFIPSAQGIPLQLKSVATAVITLQSRSRISLEKTQLQATKGLSVAINSFVGYTVGAKVGLRARAEALIQGNNSLHVNVQESKFEGIVDMPLKFNVLNVSAQAYMMTKLPAQEDQRTAPRKGYSTVSKEECSSESVITRLGVKVCWKASLPDFKKAQVFPLGDYDAEVVIQKQSPHKELVKVEGIVHLQNERRGINMKLKAPGANQPLKGEVGLEYNSEPGTASLEAYGRSVNGQKKTVKVDVKNVKSSNGRYLGFIAFYGRGEKLSRSDKILSLALKRERQGENTERKMDLKTHNLLAQYIQANIEADIATRWPSSHRVPKELDIRKLEVNIEVPEKLSTISFIRKRQSSESSSGVQYDIQTLTKTPSQELLRATGTIESKGRLLDSNHESRLNLSVSRSKKHFETESALVWTPDLKQALLRVKRVGSSHHSFQAEVSVRKQPSSTPSYSTKAEIEIPSMSVNYQLEGSVQEKSPRDYQLKLFAKKDHRSLYQISGPMTLSIGRDNCIYEQESEISVKDLSQSQEYSLGSQLRYCGEKMRAKVDVKSNGVRTFTAEGEVERNGNAFTSAAAMTIPRILDAKLKAEKTPAVMQLVLNGYLQPNTPESNRFKAFTSLNQDQKELKAIYNYNIDRDPKKLQFTAKYDYDLDKLFASAKGEIQNSEESYKYNAEALLGLIARESTDKNAIKLSLKNARGRELLQLDCTCQCPYTNSPSQMTMKTLLNYSPQQSDSGFRTEGTFDMNLAKAPSFMFLKGQAKLERPSAEEVLLKIDTQLDLQARHKKAHALIDILKSQRSLGRTNIEFADLPDSFKAKLEFDCGSSSDFKVDGHVQMTKPESQLVGDGSLQLNVKLQKAAPYSLRAQKENQAASISLSTGDSKILALEHSYQQGKWQAKLTTPLRELEAHSQYSPEKASVLIYPNRKESDEKYHLQGHFHRSDSRLASGAQFSYPGSESGIGVRTDVSMEGSSAKGTFELDIFRSPKDKIVFDIQTTKLAAHSYKLEADVKIPSHNMVPRVDLNVTMSPAVKRLEMAIRKSPAAAPSVNAIFSILRSTEKDSSLYASLETSSDKYELISALQSHDLLQCRGSSINGTLSSRRHGSYDFASAVCAPGYIELGAKKSSSDKMFLAKLGMKNPASLKVALDLVYNSSKAITVESVRKMECTMNLYGRHEYVPKIPMLLVGAKLWSPKIVSLDVHYNATGMKEFMETVVRPALRGAKRVSSELLDEVPKDLEITMPEISPALKQELKDKLIDELSCISKELQISLPSWDDIKKYLKELPELISRELEQIMQNSEEILKKYFNIELKDIEKCLQDLDQYLRETIRTIWSDIKRFIVDGRSALKKDHVLLSAVQWIEESSFMDWLEHHIKKVEEKLDADFKALKELAQHYYNVMCEEASSIYHYIMDSSIAQHIIKWIDSWFNKHPEDDSTLLGTVSSKMFRLSANERVGSFRVQIPLRRPVASIFAAPSSLGVSMPSGKLIHYARRPISTIQNTVQPISSISKVQQDSLTTFDGLVSPICYSRCEILLAKAFGNKVMLKKPSPSKTVVKVDLQSGKNIVMVLEAGKNPKVSVLKRSTKMVLLPGAAVTKVSDSEVKVDIEGLILRAEGDTLTVEAKPEAFSKLEGILGNNDHEKGNDIHQDLDVSYVPESSQGSHHLTKHAAKKLFEHFRLDKSCNIPRL